MGSFFSLDIHMNSSCSRLNGGCKHICLATPTGPRCACPDGKRLANGTECEGMLQGINYVLCMHGQRNGD